MKFVLLPAQIFLMTAKVTVFLFAFFLLAYNSVFSQETSGSEANVLFYNVENLFNPEDNKGKNDSEYQPEGVRHWTHSRKEKKQTNISRVILSAGKWNPPVLVGLCEVEDEKVLQGLIWNTGLNNLNYYYEHFESPDLRGIDVALLYRKDRFRVLNSGVVPVVMGEDSRPTRDILLVKGILDEVDTLHVMVNHWPSRWGGAGATQLKRMIAARTLKKVCDSVLRNNHSAKIIAMGDFNDGPEDESMRLVGKAPGEDDDVLINLAHNPDGPLPGTIKHEHRWAYFDQILVSENLCSNKTKNKLRVENTSMKIIAPEFLTEEDPNYPGLRPWRTYLGYQYIGGYSDHLPVMMKLVK